MRVQVVALTAALVAAPALAFGVSVNSFNQIIAFGDSLSDAGNASFFAQTNGIPNIPPPGYATRTVGPVTVGYYTNPQFGSGPQGLWIDQLAAKMGLSDPTPALLGGTNFAVASATATGGGIQDMSNQIGTFELLGNAPKNALYTFWGGANDLFNNAATGTQAADAIASEIRTVWNNGQGGQYFLWLNLPQLGETPRGASNASALNTQSTAFDNEMLVDSAILRGLGIQVVDVDINSLFQQLLGNPGAYGFSNATQPCYGNPACTNQNSYLFWDVQHPTTEGDSFVANTAFNALVGVPEPATFGFAILGVAGLLAVRRARRSRS